MLERFYNEHIDMKVPTTDFVCIDQYHNAGIIKLNSELGFEPENNWKQIKSIEQQIRAIKEDLINKDEPLLAKEMQFSVAQNSSKLVSLNSKPNPALKFEGFVKPFREVANLWWKKAKSSGKNQD